MRGPDFTHGRFTTVDGYLVAQAEQLARNASELPGRYRATRPHDDTRATVAYINHGRWLVDCSCGSGVATSPAFGIACCFSCGAIYRQITFPLDADAIATTLEGRPIEKQNWKPGETIAQLRAENVEHGLLEKEG